MSDETLAALMAENAGLRASVNKYKRRAELANTRALSRLRLPDDDAR